VQATKIVSLKNYPIAAVNTAALPAKKLSKWR